MEKVRLYIKRWNKTNKSYYILNASFALIMYLVTLNIVKTGVFEKYSDTKACLFALLMCNIWQGLFNSLMLFIDESEFIVDEMSKFLSVRAYIGANILLQLGICLFEALECSFVFSFVFEYEKTGFVFDSRSTDYFITFFLILISCDMLGLAIGVGIKGVKGIMYAVPLVLIVQFLFSGCLFDLSETVQTLSNVTTAKWGFRALAKISNINSLLPPKMSIDEFNATSGSIMHCWNMMFVIACLCALLAGLFLYLRMNLEDN